MNPKTYLENVIRGWLPKEPNLPSLQRATNRNHVRSHKTQSRIGLVLFLSLFIINCIAEFFDGHAMAVLWLWFSGMFGLFLALDILVSRGKELNEKWVASGLLAVIYLGGVLVNLYIFSIPTSFGARIFSLSVLVLVHVPLLIALSAYAWSKKDFSGKLIGWVS